MPEDQVHLAVAGVGLTLRDNGAHRTVLQDARYRPFLVTDPATGTVEAATIDVDVAEVNRDHAFDSPQTILEGQTLSYRIYGGEGFLDAEAGAGWLQMSAEKRIAHGALENYLRVAYAMLLVRYEGFLFHSAGMIRNGRGVVFYGHSGSGKSTTSRLSRPHAALLSDDLVAVRKHGDVWRVHGTPFWGDLGDQSRTNASAPLRGLFGLAKDTQVKLERLSSAQRALAVADVVSSVPVTSQEPGLSERLVDLCVDLVAQVPCYRLHFTLDDAFWSVVDEELDRTHDV